MKRIFDFSLALVAGIVLLPIILVVAFLIQWRLGSPVFFKQQRPGLAGKPFMLYKFRTMSDARDEDGKLLLDEVRLGRFGQTVRKLSLDELPQLWNVLIGDMSLVGPRPLLMQYLQRYSAHQARRHEVRPGITGWAQVNGRNAISWAERFDLDVWYVDHHSFWLDLRILMMTAQKVFSSRDVNAVGHVTMPEFMGNSEKRP